MSDNRLQDYLDEQGRITRWPGKRYIKDQVLLLDYLAEKFDPERQYSERELNDILKQYHTFEDWALLRRELFDRAYFNREKDGSRYWRTPNTRFL